MFFNAALPHRFEADVEDGPPAGDRLHPDPPTVTPDDALADGESQADPPLLRGEERDEDLLERLAADPLSRVPDGDAHRVAGIAFDPGGPDRQRAALRHRLDGVDGNVQDDLMDLLLVHRDERQMGMEFQMDLDPGRDAVRFDDGHCFFDDRVYRSGPQIRRVRPGVVEELGDHAVEAIHLFGDHVEKVPLLGAFRLRAEDLGGSLDGAEGVPDFVGKDGGHLFQQQRLFLFELLVEVEGRREDVLDIGVDPGEQPLEEDLERSDGDDDEEGDHEDEGERRRGAFAEETDDEVEENGGEEGHDQDHKGAAHEVVEFRQMGMGDHDQDEVEHTGQDQVEQRRKARRCDCRRGGDDEVDEPLLFHAGRLPLCMDDEGEVTHQQDPVRIKIHHQIQRFPSSEGSEEEHGEPCAEESRAADVALPDQGLFGVEGMTEPDHERGDGQEPEPFDEQPCAVVGELAEQHASAVEGDGQAEGGEGEVQRIVFLGDHQGHGYRDAYRHQHEDFHRL